MLMLNHLYNAGAGACMQNTGYFYWFCQVASHALLMNSHLLEKMINVNMVTGIYTTITKTICSVNMKV